MLVCSCRWNSSLERSRDPWRRVAEPIGEILCWGLRRDLVCCSGLVFLSSSLEPGRLVGRKLGQGNPPQSHSVIQSLSAAQSHPNYHIRWRYGENVQCPWRYLSACVPWSDPLLQGRPQRGAGPLKCDYHRGRLAKFYFFIMRSLASAPSVAGRSALPMVDDYGATPAENTSCLLSLDRIISPKSVIR